MKVNWLAYSGVCRRSYGEGDLGALVFFGVAANEVWRIWASCAIGLL